MTGTSPATPATRAWADGAPIEAPLRMFGTVVPADWVDYNGHMSESCYLLVAGDNSDQFFRYIGIDEAYRAAGHSLYTVETHIRFLREASLDESLSLTLQVLGFDRKRVHINHEIHRDPGEGAKLELLATVEQMLLHVDAVAGAVTPMPDLLHDRIGSIAAAHAPLGVPDYVGHVMSLPAANT
jgi:acyl-CoA thioester hydrolase